MKLYGGFSLVCNCSDKSDMQGSSTEQYLSDKLCRGSQLLWVYRTPVFYSPFLFRMAQPGGDVQLESSSEVYRELAVDVEGLEETDGNKGQKKGDLKIIQNGTFLLICNWSLIVNFCGNTVISWLSGISKANYLVHILVGRVASWMLHIINPTPGAVHVQASTVVIGRQWMSQLNAV